METIFHGLAHTLMLTARVEPGEASSSIVGSHVDDRVGCILAIKWSRSRGDHTHTLSLHPNRRLTWAWSHLNYANTTFKKLVKNKSEAET